MPLTRVPVLQGRVTRQIDVLKPSCLYYSRLWQKEETKLHTYFTIIDETKRIGACTIDEIPEDLRKDICKNLVGYTLDEVALFYDKRSDFIVVNQEHKLFDIYKSFIVDLLGFTKSQLVELKETFPESIKSTLEVILQVLEVRAVQHDEK